MLDPEDICERFWNLPIKPEEETKREQLFLDDIIQKAHLDREIESRLNGISTVIDVGAGTGRFSIPLARKGLKVTHFDISTGMIEKAREAAERAQVLDQMAFQEGRLSQLTEYRDGQFDLVICTDAPISYAYPKHQASLSELVRIAGKAVVVSVSSRLGYIPLCLNPIQKEPYLVDPASKDRLVQFYTRDRDHRLASWEPNLEALRSALTSGLCSPLQDTDQAYHGGQTPWPHNYLFMPDELMAMLSASGVTEIRLSGPGALSRGLPNEILKQLLLTDEHRETFLDICYQFDSHPAVCGLGKDNLVASGCMA
jgi:ubiquinone/menaquinone biosynthesis C-methylase UbiE